MESESKEKLVFFAFGDWGIKNQLSQECAKAMDDWANKNQKPAFILVLGDNFYPDGVDSIDDPQFVTNWKEGYLNFPALQVPWNIILGNHDYSQLNSATSQIEYTNCVHNDKKLWNCPSTHYSFSHALPNKTSIDFFGIDTNGSCSSWYKEGQKFTQGLPGTLESRDFLEKELKNSLATWKIVFGHHPLFTSRPNKKSSRLRAARGADVDGPIKGFGFQDLFVEHNVSAYFSGHEHVFSCHQSEGVHHFVCGAISETVTDEWLNSSGELATVDWFDNTYRHGFVVALVDDKTMEVIYYDTQGEEMHKVVISQ